MAMKKEDRSRELAEMRQVGKRVRHARQAKGLTLEQVAEAAETSVQFLTQVEKGEQCMTIIKFSHLAQTLGVSCDYLLYGQPPAQETAALASEFLAALNPIEREYLALTVVNMRRLMDAIAPQP